jgi:catechol 2,3-dioxygenase-like lactoylglutathione lyase family enzyme
MFTDYGSNLNGVHGNVNSKRGFARSSGLEATGGKTWPGATAGESGLETVGGEREQGTMSQTVTPQFRITDAQRSLAFYVDGLGFTVDWEHRFEPGFPVFMQLTRAGQQIFLTEHEGDCKVGGAAYFVVPDVDACHEAFVSRGVVPTECPTDQAWGPREMVVTDPDGNRLRFANDLGSDRT